MYGYNSVGIMSDGAIKVEVEEVDPINAVFTKDKIEIGRLSFKPQKDKEIIIKVTVK